MKNKGLVSICILLVVSLIMTGIFRIEQKKIDHQELEYTQKLNKKQKELATISKVTNDELLQKAPYDDTRQQVVTSQKVDEKAKKLFEILLTFGDSKEYRARKEKAQSLVTNKVLNDSKIFGSDKDVSGKSYIDTLKIYSTYRESKVYSSLADNDNMTVVVNVSYSSGRDNLPEATNHDVYKLQYNLTQDKFTDIKKIGNTDTVTD